MKKKKIIISIILIIIISCIIFINYDNTNNTVLMDEEKEIISSSNISMMLETGVSTGVYEMSNDTSWPTSGYTFNESLSSCENDSTLTWDSTTGSITVGINVNDKCYIYFDVEIPKYTISEILATKKIGERTDFSIAFTEDTTGIVYQTTDNDGYTYYWAGDATDNYVYFAGFYWRIVRVNGDGTIRLIYDGTVAHENGEASSDRYIKGLGTGAYVDMSHFNSSDSSDPYYSSSDSDSDGLKYRLDYWYYKYLEGTEYENYIYQNGKFCNDVEVHSDDSYTFMSTYYYAISYYSNYRITNYGPSLECSNEDDVYNVGTLSADEVMFVGGADGLDNTSYYLYIGYKYFTMSPSDRSGRYGYAYFYSINAEGSLDTIGGSSASSGGYAYAKVVINLNSDVLLIGSGTIDSPYEVYMG